MSRGKSKNRKARIDIMRSNARRRAREYERQAYDKPVSHEGEGGKPKTRRQRRCTLHNLLYKKDFWWTPPFLLKSRSGCPMCRHKTQT